MPLIPYRINAMTRGIISEDMSQRLDTDFYLKGLKKATNVELLPQGPVRRRNGFAWLANQGLNGVAYDNRARLSSMKVSQSIQFQIIIQEEYIEMFRNGILASRISNGLAQLSKVEVTAAGSGYVVGEKLTFSNGVGADVEVASVDGSGGILTVSIINPGYDFPSTPTVGITTAGGSGATFSATLADAHVVPYQWDDLEELKFTGSNETLYIFHPNYRTLELQRQSNDFFWTCQPLVESPEPSIKYASDRGIKLRSNSGTEGTGRILTSDLAIFTPAWVDRWVYLRGGYGQITGYTSATQVTWRIDKDIGADPTVFTESWEQSIESEERGYATCGVIYQDRLYKAGFRSRPNTVAASQTGDFTNYDDTDPELDDSAFVFTINSDQSDRIQNILARDNLQIFTDGTEWIMLGNPGITPTEVSFQMQTTVGSVSTPPLSVDNESYFVSRTGDQLMAFRYSFNQDGFITNNYSIVTGNLLDNVSQMAFHRSWLDSQANYVYCVNRDGTLAVLAISVEQEILGWSLYETDGNILSAVVTTVNNDDGTDEDRLFILVERDVGVNFESLSAAQLGNGAYIHLDSFTKRGPTAATNTFNSFGHLAGEEVTVINGDGVDLGDFTVDAGDFSLTLDTEETEIYVGLKYESTIQTMDFDVTEGVVLRGQGHRMSYVDLDLRNTAYLKIQEGNRGAALQERTFRRFETSNFDSPAPLYTGIDRTWMNVFADELSNGGAQMSLKISSDRPLPFQVNGMIIWLTT